MAVKTKKDKPQHVFYKGILIALDNTKEKEYELRCYRIVEDEESLNAYSYGEDSDNTREQIKEYYTEFAKEYFKHSFDSDLKRYSKFLEKRKEEALSYIKFMEEMNKGITYHSVSIDSNYHCYKGELFAIQQLEDYKLLALKEIEQFAKDATTGMYALLATDTGRWALSPPKAEAKRLQGMALIYFNIAILIRKKHNLPITDNPYHYES